MMQLITEYGFLFLCSTVLILVIIGANRKLKALKAEDERLEREYNEALESIERNLEERRRKS